MHRLLEMRSPRERERLVFFSDAVYIDKRPEAPMRGD
jgi:hypothetical protein